MARTIGMLMGCALAIWIAVGAAHTIRATMDRVNVAIEQAGG